MGRVRRRRRDGTAGGWVGGVILVAARGGRESACGGDIIKAIIVHDGARPEHAKVFVYRQNSGWRYETNKR